MYWIDRTESVVSAEQAATSSIKQRTLIKASKTYTKSSLYISAYETLHCHSQSKRKNDKFYEASYKPWQKKVSICPNLTLKVYE